MTTTGFHIYYTNTQGTHTLGKISTSYISSASLSYSYCFYIAMLS